jgi:hypothetical protein
MDLYRATPTVIDDESIQKFFEERQLKSTKKNTAWGMKIFQGKKSYFEMLRSSV